MKAKTLSPILFQFLFLALLLAFWFAATRWLNVPVILLPPPRQVLTQFVVLMRSGNFLSPLRVTVFEVASAFFLAAMIGLSTGYAVARSSYAIQVFEPLFTAIYAIPAILFFPLYVLLFGIGPGSKIALGATISFFPIALSTISGFRPSDSVFVKAAVAMGASAWQMFRYVLAPAAFPTILAGLRIGLILSFLSVLGAETIASFAGLGHEIMQNSQTMDSATMYAYIVFVVMVAAALNFALNAMARRWGPQDSETAS